MKINNDYHMTRNGNVKKNPVKVRKFKSYEDYMRWLHYGHATKVFKKTPGNQKIIINNKKYKVKH